MPRSEQTETRRRGRARASWPTGHTSIFLDRVGSLRLIPPFEYSGFSTFSTPSARTSVGVAAGARAPGTGGSGSRRLSARGPTVLADGLVRAGDAYQSTVHLQPRSHVGPTSVASPGGASSRKSRGARIPWRIRTGSRAWTAPRPPRAATRSRACDNFAIPSAPWPRRPRGFGLGVAKFAFAPSDSLFPL